VTLAWLLTYTLHSTVLITAVWLVARRFPDEHPWLDVAWKAALFGPIVTATIQLAGGMAPIGVSLPLDDARPRTVAAVERAPQPREVQAPRVQVSRVEPVEPAAAAAAEAGDPTPAETAVASSVTVQWPAVVTAAWASMAAVLLTMFAVRVVRVQRALLRDAHEPPADLTAAAEALGSPRKTSAVRLAVSPACAVPLAMTGRRVVLPERMLGELDPQEQHAALAHEIAHVIRRDPAWRLAAGIVERLAFFQPLNRLARRGMCETAEFLCDQWAIGRIAQPIALARSLATVASWATPSDTRALAGASAMAHSDSPLVRRVTSILARPPQRVARHARLVAAVGLLGVAAAAPGVLAAPPPEEPQAERIENRRILRPPVPGDPLEQRWRWALDEASRQRLRDFWIVYSFTTPTHADHLMMADSREGSFISSSGKYITKGPALDAQLDGLAAAGRGAVVSMFHHTAPQAEAIDRARYSSRRLGFSFGSSKVFWLGAATEADSFDKVTTLLDQVRFENGQTMMIELASLHPTTDRVLPFLTGLVDDHARPEEIRQEAAEGFDHHHVPRSVTILMRVARTDPSVEVRAEAAETIGEVQTPESIPGLMELATSSQDERVRSEAAEALGEQPADAAIPAIERLIATSTYEDVLAESLEALAEFKDARVLPILVRTATSHANQRAQQEAVETIGEVEDTSAVAALVEIIWHHTDVVIQREAVETLGDRSPVPTAELRRVRKEHPSEEVREEAQETLDEDRSERP